MGDGEPRFLCIVVGQEVCSIGVPTTILNAFLEDAVGERLCGPFPIQVRAKKSVTWNEGPLRRLEGRQKLYGSIGLVDVNLKRGQLGLACVVYFNSLLVIKTTSHVNGTKRLGRRGVAEPRAFSSPLGSTGRAFR